MYTHACLVDFPDALSLTNMWLTYLSQVCLKFILFEAAIQTFLVSILYYYFQPFCDQNRDIDMYFKTFKKSSNSSI